MAGPGPSSMSSSETARLSETKRWHNWPKWWSCEWCECLRLPWTSLVCILSMDPLSIHVTTENTKNPAESAFDQWISSSIYRHRRSGLYVGLDRATTISPSTVNSSGFQWLSVAFTHQEAPGTRASTHQEWTPLSKHVAIRGVNGANNPIQTPADRTSSRRQSTRDIQQILNHQFLAPANSFQCSWAAEDSKITVAGCDKMFSPSGCPFRAKEMQLSPEKQEFMRRACFQPQHERQQSNQSLVRALWLETLALKHAASISSMLCFTGLPGILRSQQGSINEGAFRILGVSWKSHRSGGRTLNRRAPVRWFEKAEILKLTWHHFPIEIYQMITFLYLLPPWPGPENRPPMPPFVESGSPPPTPGMPPGKPGSSGIPAMPGICSRRKESSLVHRWTPHQSWCQRKPSPKKWTW